MGSILDPPWALRSALISEVSRAEAAEVALGAAVGAEVTRATAAEGTISTAVSTETARALAAEATLVPKTATYVGATTNVVNANVVGDTLPRYKLDASGTQSYGSGAAVADLTTSRAGVGVWAVAGRQQINAAAVTGITAATNTVDGVVGQLVVAPNGNNTSGIIVKSPSTTWGAAGETAPGGDPLYGTGQFIAFEKEGNSSGGTSDMLMFRVDRTGGVGFTGGLHVATGLRQRAGYTATESVWLEPQIDMAAVLVIDSPPMSGYSAFPFLCVDTPTGVTQFAVLAGQAGTQQYGDSTVRLGQATQVRVGSIFGVPGIALGSALDTILFRSSAGVAGLQGALLTTGNLVSQNALTNQVVIGGVGGYPGIGFGTAFDVMLQRTLAGQALLTGSLSVTGSFRTGTSAIAGDDTRLARFHQCLALAAAGTGLCDILYVGDSLTEGTNATAEALRWVELATRHLQARHNAQQTGGPGYHPVVHNCPTPPIWTTNAHTGTVTSLGSGTTYNTWGLGSRAVQLTADATAIATTPTPTDRLTVLFGTGPGLTQISISIDGGAPTLVDAYSAAVGESNWASAPLARATHTVTVTPAAGGANPSPPGSPTCVVEGVMLMEGDNSAGVRMWEAGHGGALSSDFISPGTAPWLAAGGHVDLIQPALIVIEFGINDFVRPPGPSTPLNTPTQVTTNLSNLIGLILARCTVAPSIAIVIPPTPETLSSGWAPYAAALRQMALIFGWVIVDAQAKVDPNTNTGLTGDQIHPTNAGERLYAQAFLEAVAESAPAPANSRAFTQTAGLLDADALSSFLSLAPNVPMLIANRATTVAALNVAAVASTTAPIQQWELVATPKAKMSTGGLLQGLGIGDLAGTGPFIVCGTSAMQVVNGAIGQIPFSVNAITGSTNDLQQWQIANAIWAAVTIGGVFRGQGISDINQTGPYVVTGGAGMVANNRTGTQNVMVLNAVTGSTAAPVVVSLNSVAQAAITTAGQFQGSGIADLAVTGPYVVTGPSSLQINNRATGQNALLINAVTATTADLTQWLVNNVEVAGVTTAGFFEGSGLGDIALTGPYISAAATAMGVNNRGATQVAWTINGITATTAHLVDFTINTVGVAFMSAAGLLGVPEVDDFAQTGPRLIMGAAAMTAQNRTISQVPWTVNGITATTAHLAEYQVAGANVAFLTAAGVIQGAGLTDLAGVGASLTAGSTSITILNRATTAIPFIVNTVAAQTADITQWQVNGTAVAAVNFAGQFRGAAIIDTAQTGSYLALTSTIAFFANRATTVVPLTAAGIASTTAHLQDWSVNGVVKASMTSVGNLLSPEINDTAATGPRLQMGASILSVLNRSTGQVPLTVNGVTSTTADLTQWQINAVSQAKVLATGYFAGTGLQDLAGTSPYLTVNATNLTLTIRTATHNGLIVNGASAQSADLAQFQVAASTKAKVTSSGQWAGPILLSDALTNLVGTSTTSATLGTALALPTLPQEFATVLFNGNSRKLALYLP